MAYMVFPTAFDVVGPPFFQKYWWLRSPNTVFDDAWVVTSSGDNGNHNVYYSYGVIPPDPYWGELTLLVYPSGDRGNYNGNSYVYRSYGHLTR